MMSLIIIAGILIPILVLIFMGIYLSKKYGELKSEIEALREVDQHDKEQDKIASEPNKPAAVLLEWMRSPHSNH